MSADKTKLESLKRKKRNHWENTFFKGSSELQRVNWKEKKRERLIAPLKKKAPVIKGRSFLLKRGDNQNGNQEQKISPSRHKSPL